MDEAPRRRNNGDGTDDESDGGGGASTTGASKIHRHSFDVSMCTASQTQTNDGSNNNKGSRGAGGDSTKLCTTSIAKSRCLIGAAVCDRLAPITVGTVYKIEY